MSPRPQLAIGDYGAVSYAYDLPKVTAKCRFRGMDGVTRQVSALGVGRGRDAKAITSTGKNAALAALKSKINELKRGSDSINSETRLKDLAETWYAGQQTEGLKYNTLKRNRAALDNHITPKIGGLKLREATTSRLDLFIRDVSVKSGPSAAAVVRSVLSGIFTEAQRYDAVDGNPVAATRVPKIERKAIRALSLDEFLGMRAFAQERMRPLTWQERFEKAGGDKYRMGGVSRSQTPLDVIDFLIGTGVRPAEVLGLRWDDVHLDAEVPWVHIHQQIIRETGKGLVFAPTKERDERRLALPAFAVEMLRRRQELPGNEWGVVFANARNKLMCPDSMRGVWNDLFRPSVKERKEVSPEVLAERYPWAWVTQKTLRKTVATLIAEAGGSVRAADQLGHTSDRMTKLHYIAPSLLPLDEREILDALGGDGEEAA